MPTIDVRNTDRDEVLYKFNDTNDYLYVMGAGLYFHDDAVGDETVLCDMVEIDHFIKAVQMAKSDNITVATGSVMQKSTRSA